MDHVVALPGARAAAAPPAPAPARKAEAETPWRSPVKARVALAKALLLLGGAAAELSLISIALTPEASRFMGACAPTDADEAALRNGSMLLLLAAVAQVLMATVALLVPARPSALAATALAALTAYRASAFLLMLAACHGHIRGASTAFEFVAVVVAQFAVLFVAVVVSVGLDLF